MRRERKKISYRMEVQECECKFTGSYSKIHKKAKEYGGMQAPQARIQFLLLCIIC